MRIVRVYPCNIKKTAKHTKAWAVIVAFVFAGCKRSKTSPDGADKLLNVKINNLRSDDREK